jgi:hypothetical protein
LFALLNGATYEAVIPIAEKLVSGVIQFISLTPIGEWKAGRIVELLHERQEQVISLVLNCFFGLSFLALFPLVGARSIWNGDQAVGVAKV